MTAASTVLAGGELRYSTVWEDHLLLERGLEPQAGDDVLVLSSAGDNVLNLLLREPRRIVALDINPAQSAIVELQIAAIASLDHAEFLQLMGFVPPTARLALYDRVRGQLSDMSRSWWDDRASIIESGIAESGRLERYIAGFRESHLDRDVVERLLSSRTLAEQRAIARDLFTPAFARAFTDYFSAERLGARGRDASQMRYVSDETDVAGHFLSRLQWACTELPLAGNFYVERFLRGGLRDVEMGPPYLRRQNFERLRALTARVEIVTSELGDYLSMSRPGSLNHAALSDVFEYLSEESTAALVDRLARVIRPGGRIAYWNLLVPRAGSETSSRVRWLDTLSATLSAVDRAWFYRSFRVEEIVDLSQHKVPARGRYDEAARRDRLDWISDRTETSLDALRETRLVPERLTGNVENMIGAVEIPVGLAGPLLVHGGESSGIVYAPFATTEGALVASASRGATALTRAGGVRVDVIRQRMTRAPAFELASPAEAGRFAAWLDDQLDLLRAKCREVSRHAELIDLSIVVDGAVVHVLFNYTTAEAAGQNMTTATTWHCCQWIAAQVPGLSRFVIDGNMSADKKVNLSAAEWGRGTAVVAECVLDAASVVEGLKVEPRELMAVYEIVRAGARHANVVSMNVNVANCVAAIFAATGQDIASVHESSLGSLELFPEGDGIRARLFMPGLVVGTVGGGTHLPAQRALLDMMGCSGEGSSRRLAEIIAGFCLALDLSTLAAITTGEFATAHERLGRRRTVRAFGAADLDAPFFARALQREVRDLEKLEADSGSSILSELTARRLGKAVGLHHRRVHHDTGHTDVVVKVKPLDVEVMLMMQTVAAGCGDRLAREHARFRADTGFAGCHLRELAIYGQTDPRFVQHAPRVYDIHRDDAREAFVLVLERLDDVRLMDSADDPSGWTPGDIEAAIRGAGQLHSIWMGRERELAREPWIGLPPSTERMVAMAPLWDALAEHAASEFPELMTAPDLRRQKNLIESLPDWWQRLEAMPHTLIHNDFNPRNIALRPDGRLCAYDWELATIHVPQHDIAELLAFVLSPPTVIPSAARDLLLVDRQEVMHYIELHRRSVAEAGAQVPDAREWRAGFAFAARDLLINRFGLYLMGYTANHWHFLDRTLATLRALVDLDLDR